MITSQDVPFILFLTGASGAGKTTAVDNLSKTLNLAKTKCLHFDSIGVPSEADMIRDYGSGTRWQQVKTEEWVKKLIHDYPDKQLIIFEGQVNIDFILSAFKQYAFTNFQILLLHCDHPIRHRRLRELRKQDELVNPTMDNWAEFLKNQATKYGFQIIDTTQLSENEIANSIIHIILNHEGKI